MIKKLKTNPKVIKIFDFLTDFSTFQKTVQLVLIYVFLFYFPFTFLTLLFDRIVFFQLDHLYQFSTIIIDFRNRIYDLNFSTWDFKNVFGYDYFANFYYISVDFSLIPFLLFPFLSFHKLMWLSFLLKILVGSALFAYLLKLYNLSNKTILITSVVYGTSDLFFAQNVFPTYTGLIFYIPLILVAIELIIQKKNYLLFSLVIFQMFLFNFYWSWPLSLFMAISLLTRYLFKHFNKHNFYKPTSTIRLIFFLFKCIFFYLIGFGLTAFFLFPIFNIMLNEPRMDSLTDFNIKHFLSFDKNVYFKVILKMLIPNLYSYDGYFYDHTQSYFLPTNHIIIFTSIFVSFTFFQYFFQPYVIMKEKLNPNQLKTWFYLKGANLFSFIFMMLPLTAVLFSGTTTPYLRYFIFFGVLLIINFAFMIEYKLFNKKLFIAFLITSSVYLSFSIIYNIIYDNGSASFYLADLGITITLLVFYITSIVLLIVLKRKKKILPILFLSERIISFVLIFAICVFYTGFSVGVKQNSLYGKEMNNLYKQTEHKYGITYDFLITDEFDSFDPMQNMVYYNKYPTYNNFNIFHSLINPYYNVYSNSGDHLRSYNIFNTSYFYYLYTDPRYTIVSINENMPYSHYLQPPNSQLVGQKEFKRYDTRVELYETEPNFSIGTGFSSYYVSNVLNKHDYLWLDSFYTKDYKLIEELKEVGFKEENIQTNEFIQPIKESEHKPYRFKVDFEGDFEFTQFDFNLTRDQTNVILINYYGYSQTIQATFLVDFEGEMYRCFNRFCQVPETGIQSIIIGYHPDHINPEGVSFYKVNQEKVLDKLEELKKYSTYDLEIQGNTIKTKVDTDKPLIMNFKIGYAKGWKAYVDGKQVETFEGHGGLLSFALTEPTKEEHTITLVYETPWLKEGLKVSLGTLSLFTLLLTIHILLNRQQKSF